MHTGPKPGVEYALTPLGPACWSRCTPHARG
ncbi:hypothetical protein [Actinoallomurus sp. NPDC052274]